MKHRHDYRVYRPAAVVLLLGLALVFCASLEASEPTAVQTEVPGLLYGVRVDNPQLSIAVVRPRSTRWSVQYGASAVWSRAEGAAYRQLSVKALGRRALGGNPHTPSGWFAAVGATAAWFRMDGTDSVTAVVFGPACEAGYRLVPGAGAFLLEPYLGAAVVLGPRFGAGGGTQPGSNAGLYGGISVGWLLGG